MRVHPCDVLGQGVSHPAFEFKAHQFNSTEIIIEVPVLDYTDVGKDDEAVRQFLLDKEDNKTGSGDDKEQQMSQEYDVIMEALDVGRNKLTERINNKTLPIKKQY